MTDLAAGATQLFMAVSGVAILVLAKKPVGWDMVGLLAASVVVAGYPIVVPRGFRLMGHT